MSGESEESVRMEGKKIVDDEERKRIGTRTTRETRKWKKKTRAGLDIIS